MAQDPRFGLDDATAYYADKPRSTWLRSCLVGCLWTAAVLTIVAVLGAIWLSRRWRELMANPAAQAIKQSIDAANLPAAEKTELGVQIDRVADAFKLGRLSGDQLGEIMRRILESPLAVTIAVEVVETRYFDASGLTEEEQIEGLATLRRFARGAIDETIPAADRDAVLERIATRRDDDAWELREKLSDEELRAFLAAAAAAADAAGTPDQPENVDPSDELQRIVDEALEQGDRP
jgi:hypothetical protein